MRPTEAMDWMTTLRPPSRPRHSGAAPRPPERAWFDAAFMAAATPQALLDAEGALVDVNPAFCAAMGDDAARWRGTGFDRLLQPSHREAHAVHWRRLLSGAVSVVDSVHVLICGRRVALRLTPLTGTDGLPSHVLAQFVDANADADAGEPTPKQLRELTAHRTRLVEEERRRIAREIHDELGQLLTALRMDLALLRPRLGDVALQSQVDKLRAMVDHSVTVVRHVASRLRPVALDMGLTAAIEWLAEDFSLRWELPCEVTVDGEPFEVADDVATALFRVVQESLTNIARHADASRVRIAIACDDRRLRLAVRDDGRGFDVAAERARGRSFGLLGMHERVLKAGGTLDVSSGDAGTSVVIDLPRSP